MLTGSNCELDERRQLMRFRLWDPIRNLRLNYVDVFNGIGAKAIFRQIEVLCRGSLLVQRRFLEEQLRRLFSNRTPCTSPRSTVGFSASFRSVSCQRGTSLEICTPARYGKPHV